ncbi:MAG TPA: cytochrome P460 family protein, partial [Pirellulaceae bacterium]
MLTRRLEHASPCLGVAWRPHPTARPHRGLVLLLALHALSLTRAEDASEGTVTATPRPGIESLGKPSGLPLPSTMTVAEYEARLFAFVNERQYQALGWRADKGVRDTGPYLRDRYYGTHPAVRVYYSPEILQWLIAGRRYQIPDGAMIIKEQYDKPAIKHAGKTEEELWQAMNAWTIMVKDSSGSFDGWYWSNPQKNAVPVDNHKYPFDYPVSGFGHYCLRCHSSTASPGETNEFSFVA